MQCYCQNDTADKDVVLLHSRWSVHMNFLFQLHNEWNGDFNDFYYSTVFLLFPVRQMGTASLVSTSHNSTFYSHRVLLKLFAAIWQKVFYFLIVSLVSVWTDGKGNQNVTWLLGEKKVPLHMSRVEKYEHESWKEDDQTQDSG